MALIKCPECNCDVSDKAAACPRGAYPLARIPQGQRPVQVIEKTARRWKALRAMGWLLVVVGVLLLVAEWAGDDSRGVAVGWWIAAAGVACLWLGRAGAWWYHA